MKATFIRSDAMEDFQGEAPTITIESETFQLTYEYLRDEDGKHIATNTKFGTWKHTESGAEYSDITLAP